VFVNARKVNFANLKNIKQVKNTKLFKLLKVGWRGLDSEFLRVENMNFLRVIQFPFFMKTKLRNFHKS